MTGFATPSGQRLDQTSIANASMPKTAQEVDVSASDFTITTSGEQTTFTIYVGTGGDVEAVHANDSSSVTLKNVPNGTDLNGIFKEIKTSGTTASDIVVRR